MLCGGLLGWQKIARNAYHRPKELGISELKMAPKHLYNILEA